MPIRYVFSAVQLPKQKQEIKTKYGATHSNTVILFFVPFAAYDNKKKKMTTTISDSNIKKNKNLDKRKTTHNTISQIHDVNKIKLKRKKWIQMKTNISRYTTPVLFCTHKINEICNSIELYFNIYFCL